MKIVVPYTPAALRTETIDALYEHAAGHDIHLVNVDAHDEQLYDLWTDLWAACEDILVVEHDILIHDDVLPQLQACPEEWCSFGYGYAHFGVYHGTGCVRFRSSLMVRDPNLFRRVALLEGPKHPPRHWCSLDAYMQHELAQTGHVQHRHGPDILHLGVGVAHGCVTAPALATI